MLPLLFQGIYYTATGIWPTLSISLFIKVTGPKTDHWLVRTVGLLVCVSGIGFILAFIEKNSSAPVLVIAVGEAFILIVIDVVYSMNGTIKKIYLGDAIIESVLIAWILLSI